MLEGQIPRWHPQRFCKKNSGALGTQGSWERDRGAEARAPRAASSGPAARFSPLHPEVPPPGASGGTDRDYPQGGGSRPLLAPQLSDPGRTRGTCGHVAAARVAKYAAPAILCEKPQRRLPARALSPPPSLPAPRASAASLISVSRRCSLLTR